MTASGPGRVFGNRIGDLWPEGQGNGLTHPYTARFPHRPLKNLLQIATPVNGEDMELQRMLVTSDGFDPDLLVDTYGNEPAWMIEAAFQFMRPLQKTAGQFMLLNNLDDRENVKAHLRITRWGTDALPFAGAAFRTLIRHFIIYNKIVSGKFTVAGEPVNLGDIRIPVLHLLAEHDHVVPFASSHDLVRLVGSDDKEEMIIKGGHVSLSPDSAQSSGPGRTWSNGWSRDQSEAGRRGMAPYSCL